MEADDEAGWQVTGGIVPVAAAEIVRRRGGIQAYESRDLRKFI